MKISQNFQYLYGAERIERNDCSSNPIVQSPSNSVQSGYSYPAIYFTGKFVPSKLTPSKINLSAEKDKLVRQFDNILKNDVTEQEMTKEERHLKDLERVTSFEARKKRLREQLDNQSKMLWDKYYRIGNAGISAQSVLNERNTLMKEYSKLDKMKYSPDTKQKPKNPKDTKTDFTLINKFKSAVLDDNFDFRQVYKDYYQGLNEVKTIRELKQKYPKIDIPKNPKEVVASKIEYSLTRDFYEGLNETLETKGKEGVKENIKEKVQSILDEQLKKSTDEQKKEIKRKVLDTTVSYIARRFKKIKEEDLFSTLPYVRKIKQPLVTDTDKKLLTLDYNDFVLSVIREQYLEFKKPNEIVYKYNKGKSGNLKEHILKVSDLRDSEYKFPKIQDNVKFILNQGEHLKSIQRNYDYFSKEDFIERLVFHADRQDTNERFLDKLVTFSTCRFEGEDIDMVKKFLTEADDVLDKKKSMKDALENIDRNNISPRGTEKLNEAERQKRMQRLRAEQKRHAELQHIQTTFDDSINLLYLNDMAYSAEMCSAFRPTSLDIKQKLKSDEILNIIKKYQDKKDSAVITNKDRMATELTRWKKYIDYKKEHINDDLLEKAKLYSQDKKGNIDYDKAGKYLINYEAVETYPQSFEYARNRDAAEKIMKNFANDKDKAVEYLCKYDDYLDLTETEKTKISNILKIFDKKDPMDKSMLKDIIENEYVKSPTTEWAQMSETGSKKVKATIAPKAKEEILEYYKFPKCLGYFNLFECALPQFAAERNSAGIKKIDKNFYELKITGHDDRLIAKNGVYYFDKFDETGLH